MIHGDYYDTDVDRAMRNKKIDYGKFLKEQRKKQKISQQALADAAGVSQKAISFWEHGQRKMWIEYADKVFAALGVSVVIGKKGEAIAEV